MRIESHDEDAIIGADEAKAVLLDMLFFQYKNRDEMIKLGVPIVRGVLLYGVPGTGKSDLAKIVSWKYSLSTDHPIEIFMVKGKNYMRGRVGGSTAALDELFSNWHERINKAKECDKKNLEIIAIINEFDSIAPRKTGRKSMEMERTNAFINEFDDAKSGVFVIGTTNFPMLIDSAVIRSGRMFPIYVPIPTRDERVKIFDKYYRNIGVLDIVSAEELADNSVDFTGADIVMSKNTFYIYMKKKQEKKEVITKEDLLALLKEIPGSLKAQMDIAKFQADYMRQTGQSKSIADGPIFEILAPQPKKLEESKKVEVKKEHKKTIHETTVKTVKRTAKAVKSPKKPTRKQIEAMIGKVCYIRRNK